MRRKTIRALKFYAFCTTAIIITIFLYRTFYQPYDVDIIDEPHRGNQGSFYNGAPKNLLAKKIDWHDYKLIELERKRSGIGEHGKPGRIPESDKSKEKKLFDQNGFNGYLSDQISLNRSVADIRHKDCSKQLYLSELPTVSIIVPFFNEHWSTLLRTCYSVLNRSPAELLVEIILVDDHSDKGFLGQRLDLYVSEHLPKVRIIRLPERMGLIAARMAGARKASGDVLIFLDSHTEANTNWLPPLLDPMANDYRICVCPFIDVIAYDTFEYRAQDEGSRGAFDWEFYYKRLPLLPDDLQHPTRPFKSPIMAGGLFAITAKFFWELGGYDEGLDIWGGEQYELSFKIWQCGGEMYDAPCSRVGHIYRGGSPFPNPRKTDYLHKNYKRVAEVWMDEYKEYLYMRNSRYKNIDPGDLTKQIEIRDRLNCKPFKWFMEEIAFDLPKKYPPIEPPDYAGGTIQNVAHPNLCLDSMSRKNGQPVGVFHCAEDHKDPQYNQYFLLSWHKDVRMKSNSQCLDVPGSDPDVEVIFYACHGQQGNQMWRYDLEHKWLIQGFNRRCLELLPVEKKIVVNSCDVNKETMKWNFGYINETAIANYDKN